MSKRPATIAYIAQSRDGFIARADGAIDWLPEPVDGEDYGWGEFIAGIDAIVMRRVTYEAVSGFDFWPYEGVPLTALSTTMTAVPEPLHGKAEVSSLEPRALLLHLAERGCKRVYVDGGKTIHSFINLDLIDELVITTIPVLIGKGIPLFSSLERDIAWTHLSTETLAGGLVKTSYRRVS